MRPRRIFLPLAVLLILGATAASAQTSSDLEITMDVIDSLSDIQRSGFLTERPDEASLFELDPDAEEDPEAARARLIDQFSAMDGEFRIKNENDGFETEDEEAASRRALEAESDFDLDEQIELDVVEPDMMLIDDPDPMT